MKWAAALFAISVPVACHQQEWHPPNVQRLALVKDSAGYRVWIDTASIDSASPPADVLFKDRVITYTAYIAHRDSVPIESFVEPSTNRQPIDGAVEHEWARCSNLEYYTRWRAYLYHSRLVDSASYRVPDDFVIGSGHGVRHDFKSGVIDGSLVSPACAYAAYKHLVTVSK
jgi:hypothetical protein